MPIHSAASFLGKYDLTNIVYGLVLLGALWAVKKRMSGRTCTWERDWAGKMILIVSSPDTTTFSLIHHLLHFPRPPQILYLPPLPSPLPDELLTIINTIRLSASRNPLAQLHCDPLPRTPEGVTVFSQAWATPVKGSTSESGRRIDAVVLGGSDDTVSLKQGWTVPQYHYHVMTSLLPSLLRAPAERSIRIVSLIDPSWEHGLKMMDPTAPTPSTPSTPVPTTSITAAATVLVMRHFQLILDTLASASYSKQSSVPAVGTDGETVNVKQREQGLKSNIMSLSVIMPWSRAYMRRMVRDDSWMEYAIYLLVAPFVWMSSSPSHAIQSILFALSAPVRYKSVPAADETGVQGGDIIRNCDIVNPKNVSSVLLDPGTAKVQYEALEREVEAVLKSKQSSRTG